MFNISIFVFEFADLCLYCVGTKGAINLLTQYYKIHKNRLDRKNFIQRIISSKIYTYAESTSPRTILQCRTINKQLNQANLLMDIEQFDEATFLANPKKWIEALGDEELYNSVVTISQYWRTRFPSLPEEFDVPDFNHYPNTF